MTPPTVTAPNATQNATGIFAMLASMAAFVANDTCVKLMGDALPLGEIIALRNGAATLFVIAFGLIFGGLTLPASAPKKRIGQRMAVDLLATLCFLSGLIAMPIADATAISQATPLAMTAAAALFMQERIGWRRWLAAIVGFIGVLLIVKPGSGTFKPEALFVLASVVFIVMRDLMTRSIGSNVPTLTLTALSTAASMCAGFVLLPWETWVWPGQREVALVALSGALLVAAYAFIIIAMRSGEVGVVAPFRYAVILFALMSGWLIWGDLPDAIQSLGIVILTAAGLYTFHRDALRRAPG